MGMYVGRYVCVYVLVRIRQTRGSSFFLFLSFLALSPFRVLEKGVIRIGR